MDFTKKFNEYSNAELLKIMNSPKEYQPEAVETAKTILASRQLSEAEIEIAKVEMTSQHKEKDATGQKNNELEMQIKNMGSFFLTLVNPIGTDTTSAQKRIKIICLFICALFLILIYSEFGILRYMFTYRAATWDFNSVMYLIPFLIIPIVTILFFKHKKIGWTLIVIYATYSAISSLALFFMTQSVSSPLESIFPQPSPIISILTIAFWVGLLWTICKPDLRKIYTVDSQYMYRTLGIVTVLTVLQASGIFS